MEITSSHTHAKIFQMLKNIKRDNSLSLRHCLLKHTLSDSRELSDVLKTNVQLKLDCIKLTLLYGLLVKINFGNAMSMIVVKNLLDE